jgi:hypothetical protein
MATAFGNLAPPELRQAEALSEQAQRAFEAGEYAVAAEHYRRAMAAAPESKVYPYALGTALAAARDERGAADAFRRSISIAPEWGAPRQALAQLPDPNGAAPPLPPPGAATQEPRVAADKKRELLAKYFRGGERPTPGAVPTPEITAPEPEPEPASERFDGVREGMVYTTREGRTGYFPDSSSPPVPAPADGTGQKGVSFGEGSERECPARDLSAGGAAPLQFLDFVIPDDAAEGQRLHLRLPSGRMAEWVVPPGIEPGQACRLPLPEDEMDPSAGQQQQQEEELSGPRAAAERKREERYQKMVEEKAISGGHTCGDLVKSWQGEKGVIRYIGSVTGQSESKVWLGIEWYEPGRGKNDGSAGGKRYFTCEQGMGSFVDVRKQRKVLDNRYNQYLEAVGSAAVSTITN